MVGYGKIRYLVYFEPCIKPYPNDSFTVTLQSKAMFYMSIYMFVDELSVLYVSLFASDLKLYDLERLVKLVLDQ